MTLSPAFHFQPSEGLHLRQDGISVGPLVGAGVAFIWDDSSCQKYPSGCDPWDSTVGVKAALRQGLTVRQNRRGAGFWVHPIVVDELVSNHGMNGSKALVYWNVEGGVALNF